MAEEQQLDDEGLIVQKYHAKVLVVMPPEGFGDQILRYARSSLYNVHVGSTSVTSDPEAEVAWRRREDEYRSLSSLPSNYALDDFKVDISSAFQAARKGLGPSAELPEDEVAADHPLALMHRKLPASLRGWFQRRYPRNRADVLAWKFILAGRALARFRTLRSSEEPDDGSIPGQLMASVLAIDLGDLARTSILEPVG